MANLIFKEEQTYRGTWVMYLILMLELPTLILAGIVIWSSERDPQKLVIVILPLILIMSLVFFLLMSLKLEIRIEPDVIKYRYIPFISTWRIIPKNEITHAEVITYSPITDYGGWGLKGNKTTKAFSVLGDQGLILDVGQTKKIMLGTQKGPELKIFMENWKAEE